MILRTVVKEGMAAVLGTRAAEHPNDCCERITKLMLHDSSDAARAAEGEARIAKRMPSSSGLEIVPGDSYCGTSGRDSRRADHVSDVTVAAAVRAEATAVETTVMEATMMYTPESMEEGCE